MTSRPSDVVVVGGGIIGASIAYHLAIRAPGVRIVLLERASRPGTGATSKATGGIRQQFSTESNIRLSQLSYAEYTHFNEVHGQDIGLRLHGYLFVTTAAARWEQLVRGAELQRSLGVPTQILSPSEARAIVHDLRIDDLVGATYCAMDGSANPTEALHGYLASARARGVQLVTDAEVTAIETSAGAVSGVRTTTAAYPADVVVDAAGPRVMQVARLVDVDVPAATFQRQVFVMDAIPDTQRDLPFTVDLDTGWYVHQEAGGRLIFGGTDRDDRPGIEPEVAWDGFDAVGRAALLRVPALAERANLVTAYAGIRTLTPDDHPIIGTTPVRGFVLASACNGHGFMHAPAVGRVLAELLVDGRSSSLDLAPLSLDRFGHGTSGHEAVTF